LKRANQEHSILILILLILDKKCFNKLKTLAYII
jgi:hypothetical protein